MSTADVELKEFDTVYIPAHATAPFCVLWSDDDKIAVVIGDGVQIFELHPTPISDQLTVTFIRSYIPTNTSQPLQNVIVDNKANSYVWKLGRKEVYEIAIDSTLSSIIEKNSSSTFFTECHFSPLIYNECYLSCLTNQGLLQIYMWNLRKWKSVVNITDLWISYICKNLDSMQHVEYSYLKVKLSQLKIITMMWLDKPKLNFITGHEDGGICIWNVDTSNKQLSFSVNQYFHVTGKPTSMMMCETGLKQIFLLVIGTVLGTVKYIPLKYSCEMGLEKIGNEKELWKHNDLIRPTLIKAVAIGNDRYILTVKNYILLIQKYVIDEEGDLCKLETIWHEFSSQITSLNEYQDRYVLGTLNHDIFSMHLNGMEYTMERNVEMPLRPNHTDCFHKYGLAMSKNKVIWVVISSAKVNYDSKTMKDTMQFLIFVPKVKLYKSLSDLTCTGLVNNLKGTYRNTKLTDIADLLEIKKLELLADPSSHMEVGVYDSGSSPLELKLTLWEARLRIFTQSAEVQDVVTQCECLLALQWCSNLKLRYTEKKAELTDLEKRSLNVIEIFLNGVKSDTDGGSPCAMCGELAPVNNIRASTCCNGHTFPRCSLSLLPCDTVPYAFCRICDTTVVLDFISLNDYRCLYCDGLLVPDNRINLENCKNFVNPPQSPNG